MSLFGQGRPTHGTSRTSTGDDIVDLILQLGHLGSRGQQHESAHVQRRIEEIRRLEDESILTLVKGQRQRSGCVPIPLLR